MQILTMNEETRGQILDRFLHRSPIQFEEQEAAVREILTQVMEKGDQALLAYTEQFDHVCLTPAEMEVTDEEIRDAYACQYPQLS